ncbi:MAG: hypothetical protein WC028_26735 [Candidatus Obscuribacterales bacterium]
MRQNSNLVASAISLLLSFFTAVPYCNADESKKLNYSQPNSTSSACGLSPKSSLPVTKQTDVTTETKKEAGGTKDKNLSSSPAQVNQAILESLEQQNTGKFIFPSNCISDKESEDIHRMGQIGTMKDRLMQAGFSKERYDKFEKAVPRKGSTKTLTFSRTLGSHQAQSSSKIRILTSPKESYGIES